MTIPRAIATRIFLVLILSCWGPGDIHAINRDMTTVTVNTVGEQVLYTFAVPGNLLSTTRGIRILMWGDYLQNSGANRTLTFRLRYGAAGTAGTLVATKQSDTMASQAPTGSFSGDFVMFNTGTTNAQNGSFCVIFDRSAVVVTVVGTAQAGVAVDSTADQFLTVTVEHSGATVTLSKLGAQALLL